MSLTASQLHQYYRPERCGLRVYLRSRGVDAAPLGPFDELLIELGERHEKKHLGTFADILDLRKGTAVERIERTKAAIVGNAAALYQPTFSVGHSFGDTIVEVVGDPDFLIREGAGYVIRDCKLSRRITLKDHPEIILQLQLYGWLYEHTVGQPPVHLEVVNGAGEIVPVDYDAGAGALEALSEILALTRATTEPYSPVGWSKCSGCGYFGNCWPKAEARHDVALLPGVDQSLAWALREAGVTRYDEIGEHFDEVTLAAFERPWGKRMQKVGKAAGAILISAQAFIEGSEIVIAPPAVPVHENYVMFDLEGLPPHQDELEKIYLWGMHVYGERPSEYLSAVAGFDEDGDQAGWVQFLANASSVFETYGDVPFVHWHHYEKTNLCRYVDRFGDPEGVAARVLTNLLDLLPNTRASVVLPLSSYSLKVIEKQIGFKRTQDEYGGEWSMANYIRATEMHDEVLRERVMEKILTYNKEDLAATWAVLQWLRAKAV